MSGNESDPLRTRQYADAFARIFIGMIFLLDLRFESDDLAIDLLPDVAGWVLFATAFHSLIATHSRARFMRGLSIALAGAALFWIVEISEPLVLVVVRGVLHEVAAILEIVAIWLLCGIAKDLAAARNEKALADRAGRRRIYYLVYHVMGFLGGFVLLRLHDRILPDFSVLYTVLMLIGMVVVYALLFGLIAGVYAMYRDGTGDTIPSAHVTPPPAPVSGIPNAQV